MPYSHASPRRRWRLLAAAGAVALSCLPLQRAAAQTTLTLGDWQLFTYLLDGTSSAVNTSFTLDVAGRTRLRVAELGFSGDRFQVFANGSLLLFTTSEVPSPGTFTDFLEASDGNAAYASAELSKGETFLQAGRYTITLNVFDPGSGFEDGAGVIRADAAPIQGVVPEPATVFLAGAGLVALAAVRRRAATAAS